MLTPSEFVVVIRAFLSDSNSKGHYYSYSFANKCISDLFSPPGPKGEKGEILGFWGLIVFLVVIVSDVSCDLVLFLETVI